MSLQFHKKYYFNVTTTQKKKIVCKHNIYSSKQSPIPSSFHPVPPSRKPCCNMPIPKLEFRSRQKQKSYHYSIIHSSGGLVGHLKRFCFSKFNTIWDRQINLFSYILCSCLDLEHLGTYKHIQPTVQISFLI